MNRLGRGGDSLSPRKRAARGDEPWSPPREKNRKEAFHELGRGDGAKSPHLTLILSPPTGLHRGHHWERRGNICWASAYNLEVRRRLPGPGVQAAFFVRREDSIGHNIDLLCRTQNISWSGSSRPQYVPERTSRTQRRLLLSDRVFRNPGCSSVAPINSRKS
jgi:hypothetical protein